MKALTLTLTQPWASLVAIGAKKIETRSWSTSYRGPLAIHAAKGMPTSAVECCVSEPFLSVLQAAGFMPPEFPLDRPYDVMAWFPRGKVVAVCGLVDCLPIKIYSIGDSAINGTSYPLPAEPERSFGDYSVGRFAWLLADIRALPTPIPAKGALGLWEYEGQL